MKSHRTTILSVALAVAALAPTTALARNGADDNQAIPDDHGGQVTSVGTKAQRAPGTCTGNARTTLKVKPDGRRLETEFEVDQNRSGVSWTVTIRRNGALAARTHATTRAPSGSFTVERRLVNGGGSDRISARATSPSGQVCTVSVTV